MWFNNLRIYQLTQPWTLDAESLAEKLAEFPFHPCGKQDTARLGWVPAAGRLSDALCHSAQGQILLCLKKQERLLPGAVVNEALDEKVRQIEADEGRKVYRKEKQTMKDELIFELLPKAFTRSKCIHGYIDTVGGFVVVNTSSATRADEFLNQLRESIGSLPVVPFGTKDIPITQMTFWLTHNEVPAPFLLGEEVELQDPLNNQNKIRCRNQQLTNGELDAHLEVGKQVTQLQLAWGETLRFLLNHDLGIKRVKFSDVIMEQSTDSSGDEMAQFDANFTLMALEVNKLIQDLGQVLGGIESQV